MHNNHKMGSSDSLLKTIREIMEKKHTTPETPKEKSLAKLAHPKDKITHKDVLVGRGVLKKENSGDRMGVIVGTRKEKVELEPRLKEEADGGKHSTYTIKTSGDQKNIHKEMMKHVNPGYHHWIGQHSKKGPISDDDHKEIKRVANANDANVHVSSSKDEEGYHHVLIHSSTRESAKSTADDLYDEGGSVTRHRPKKSTRNEDVQHVTERKLTGAEAEKKEKYVMSLKGKMGGFKKRYGERAKEVMYATATKMAKEEVDIVGESKTLGKYSFSGSLGKYGYSGKSSKSDSKSEPEKAYVFKPDGKVELPKKSKQVAEVSTGMANRYLSKTQGDDKRQAGRALALKKKWGGKVGGTEAPKVPTKD